MNKKTLKNEIPEELFSPFGKNKKYKFINLDNKEETIILGASDHLSRKKCPIDRVYFVMVDDGVYEYGPSCPCWELFLVWKIIQKNKKKIF